MTTPLRSYHVPTSEPLSDDELSWLSRIIGDAVSITRRDDHPVARMLSQQLLAAWAGCGVLQDVRAGCSVSAEAQAGRVQQLEIFGSLQ